MKTKTAFYVLLLIGLLLIPLFNCKRETDTTASTTTIIFNPNLTYGSVTDIDGNIYKTITIGTQTWMAENLKTTRYRNGDAIAKVTNNASWASLSTGAFCFNSFSNDEAKYIATYGELYNWYAVADSRKLAPVGWHVPTDAEWIILTDYLGGTNVAGEKLKEIGTTHWRSSNTATNSSGFSALPGGNRDLNGEFGDYIGVEGNWWSSTESSTTSACFWHMSSYTNAYRTIYSKVLGFSVRCVKD